MPLPLRRILGLLAGCATAVAIAAVATLAARSLWPAYAVAEPMKAYSLAMLLSRLTAGAICAASGAAVATLVVRSDGRIGWWLGAILLAPSLWVHLVREWADFPVWYHFVYLGYLVPVAGLTGRSVHARLSRKG